MDKLLHHKEVDRRLEAGQVRRLEAGKDKGLVAELHKLEEEDEVGCCVG